jgi:hypothetical protein
VQTRRNRSVNSVPGGLDGRLPRVPADLVRCDTAALPMSHLGQFPPPSFVASGGGTCSDSGRHAHISRIIEPERACLFVELCADFWIERHL